MFEFKQHRADLKREGELWLFGQTYVYYPLYMLIIFLFVVYATLKRI